MQVVVEVVEYLDQQKKVQADRDGQQLTASGIERKNFLYQA